MHSKSARLVARKLLSKLLGRLAYAACAKNLKQVPEATALRRSCPLPRQPGNCRQLQLRDHDDFRRESAPRSTQARAQACITCFCLQHRDRAFAARCTADLLRQPGLLPSSQAFGTKCLLALPGPLQAHVHALCARTSKDCPHCSDLATLLDAPHSTWALLTKHFGRCASSVAS